MLMWPLGEIWSIIVEMSLSVHSFLNPDYHLSDPEFDNLDYRTDHFILMVGALWKKVICVLHVNIILIRLKFKEI